MEALERAILEIEALTAIYDDSICEDDVHEDSICHLSISSEKEYRLAEEIVRKSHDVDAEAAEAGRPIPDLSVVFALPSSSLVPQDERCERSADGGGADGRTRRGKTAVPSCTMRLTFPAGYPTDRAASASVLSAPVPAPTSSRGGGGVVALPRRERDGISERLNRRARELVGAEAAMELIEMFREEVAASAAEHRRRWSEDGSDAVADAEHSAGLGRRWIWVHHVTNAGRCKDIVREADAAGLGGYLKSGYPGIVVVEGTVERCDEFTSWIKGNKSRPGGFGRNWGHHVRGEVSIEERSLPVPVVHIDGDLAELASCCRDHEVGEEFLEYVMQHKSS
mmetsp:Transcript_37040/g.86437  ORF Transcript_37040/g.86437 Transcript_37040/m.86437 type:complete len:338 (-) Transcript_37040:47-1060(-)